MWTHYHLKPHNNELTFLKNFLCNILAGHILCKKKTIFSDLRLLSFANGFFQARVEIFKVLILTESFRFTTLMFA